MDRVEALASAQRILMEAAQMDVIGEGAFLAAARRLGIPSQSYMFGDLGVVSVGANGIGIVTRGALHPGVVVESPVPLAQAHRRGVRQLVFRILWPGEPRLRRWIVRPSHRCYWILREFPDGAKALVCLGCRATTVEYVEAGRRSVAAECATA